MFFLRVVLPIVFPIVAQPGQLLGVQPGHPTHTVAVLDRTGRRVLRHRYVEDGALYGPILVLDADGALEFLTPQDWHVAMQLAA